MNAKRTLHLMTVLILILIAIGSPTAAAPSHTPYPTPPPSHTLPRTPRADDPSPPDDPVKLIFIHHSCGENWLNDDNGGLGIALRDNNYFVSDTNYGWGEACPGCSGCDSSYIGSCTDIGHWWEWFRGTNSTTYTHDLYTEYDQHSSYSRLATDPGGENEIIMFKSCFPNSNLRGDPAADPPPIESNPLRGQAASSNPNHTVANAKSIYNALLTYFDDHDDDKLFIVVTAPPVPDDTYAANARAFNTWLVNDWLAGYAHNNVAVFDFYNVLTHPDNHHRYHDGGVQYVTSHGDGTLYYPGPDGWHPSAAGNQKARDEFAPLLNVYYNRWRGGAGPSYTFTAVITPTNATPPITYTWSSEHLIGGQGTATATYRWDTAGVYEISVKAENCGGTFTDTHTITTTSSAKGHYDDTPGASFPSRSDHSDDKPSTDESPIAARDDDAAAQQTMVFQDGVSPTAGYAGTTDVILAHDYDNVDANANLGGLDHLETFFYDDDERRRSLMRWDLSDLPSDITVNAASLELYRYGGDAEPPDMQIVLYRLTHAWTEGTGQEIDVPEEHVPDGATWLTFDGSTAWPTPGGDYDSTIVDQTTLPSDMTNGWVTLDTTAAVRAWVQDGLPNYGLMLRPESGAAYHYYHSREASNTTLRPRLVVTYTAGSILTHTVHLPLALRNHTPQPPSCPYPLTGVYISGPTSGSPAATQSLAASDHCRPLDPPTGSTATVSTVGELQSAVNSAASGDTILVEDGTYALDGVSLWFDVPNVTLRSASGNREDVILDGNYITTEIIHIVASDVTIADLTLREAHNHPIHITSSSSADTTGTLIYNVHIIDPRQQAIKINPYTGENALYFPDDGVIACSHIELTDTGRPHVDRISSDCYTGGVDAHQARDWVIRDNLIEGFWCESGLSEHGIHLWRSCRDTLVERNELWNNARGIGFGLVTSGSGIRTYSDDPCPGAGGGYVDHYGGIIRNNFVFANDGGLFASDSGFDCGICLWNACGARALHNTVVSTQVPFSSIEWFLGYTDVDVINNLVSHNLRDRSGTADLSGNLTYQPLSLFVDGANGDLHLAASASAAIDQVTRPPDVSDDFDGGTRPAGPASDVGADEYGTSGTTPSLSPTAPTGNSVWPINSQREIHWTTTGSVPQVDLYYSTHGFVTSETIASSLDNTGIYTWTTPSTPTHSARVRIASSADPNVQGTSGEFTLYDPSTLTNTVHLPLVMKAYRPPTSTNGTLIQPSNLVYQGAFRLPDSPGTPDNVGWEWSNWASAATYYPDGDPGGDADEYPGSIFGVGHDHTQYVSETSIPVPVNSPGKDVSELNTAETLQGFHDIRGSLFGAMEMPRVGLAYLPPQGEQTGDKLYFAWAPHLDEGATNPSHGWCELDISAPQTAGAWRIGEYWNYVTGDYIFEIPRAWADAYVSGRYLATGRFRDGGQGAQGPAIFAIAPWNDGNPPASGSTLGATPLLLYEDVYESSPMSLVDYHHSDEWTGATWLTASDRSAMIFVGTKGLGNCWYGCADGTDEPPWPDDCDRGWWSTSFAGQMLFYDPADLAAVARGEMATYGPQPYATLNVDDALYHVTSEQQKYHLGAAAFDRERGLLYVFEPFGDGDKPLVHVWQVE